MNLFVLLLAGIPLLGLVLSSSPGFRTNCGYCGCVATKPYIPCIGLMYAACEPQHNLRRGRHDLLVGACAPLS